MDEAIHNSNREQKKRDQARKAVEELFGVSDSSQQSINMKAESTSDFLKIFDDSAGE
jgi:hypothetical protein